MLDGGEMFCLERNESRCHFQVMLMLWPYMHMAGTVSNYRARHVKCYMQHAVVFTSRGMFKHRKYFIKRWVLDQRLCAIITNM